MIVLILQGLFSSGRAFLLFADIGKRNLSWPIHSLITKLAGPLRFAASLVVAAKEVHRLGLEGRCIFIREGPSFFCPAKGGDGGGGVHNCAAIPVLAKSASSIRLVNIATFLNNVCTFASFVLAPLAVRGSAVACGGG